MSERLPEKATLADYQMHGYSLKRWHQWLTTDRETGDYTGWLRVPCSRYGKNGEECAYWAIAAEVAYVDACGEDDDAEEALNFLMSLAVNDHRDIAYLVHEYWDAIPECLRDHLGNMEDVKQLIEGEKQ
jgi:hypothetical protein